MQHKYPSRAEILEFAGQMASGNYADFFSHVSEHVDWTIMGKSNNVSYYTFSTVFSNIKICEFVQHNMCMTGTSPMSMRYTSLKHFQEATLGRLATILKEPGLKIMVHNVIGGEEQEWATIELKANAECKNGK